MAIKKIDEISINGVQGVFAGGYIYSLSFDQQYSESINTITISILDSKVKPAPSLEVNYNLRIGNKSYIIYLISVEESLSVGEKVLVCKFSDKSFILDQYQVGLANRHAKSNSRKSVGVKASLDCPNCYGGFDRRNVDVAKNARSGNYVEGNLLVMGHENPLVSQCDFPDVNYSFQDLISVMSSIGIAFQNPPNLSINYLNKYVGSLREVLSNWCADYGGTFYWDMQSNLVRYVDLTQPINLTSIKNTIETNLKTRNIALKNYKTKSSIENTISQGVSSFQQKPEQSYESESVRNFFSVYYSPLSASLFAPQAHSTGALIGRFFGDAARTRYYASTRNWTRLGYTRGGARLNWSSDPLAPGPCNSVNGIETICEKVRANYQFFLVYYDDGSASYYREQDSAFASAYGKNFSGPILSAGSNVIGNSSVALSGNEYEDCSLKVSNTLDPSPSEIETPNGTYRGITIDQADIGGGAYQVEGLFVYGVEGQSAVQLQLEAFSGTQWQVVGIPNDNFSADVDTTLGGNNPFISIIRDTGFWFSTGWNCGQCQSSQDFIKQTCGNLTCDQLWARAKGFGLGGGSVMSVRGRMQVGGRTYNVYGPYTGTYSGFVEQNIVRKTKIPSRESYRHTTSPNPFKAMNTSHLLLDLNTEGQGLVETDSAQFGGFAYYDIGPREEISLDIIGSDISLIESFLNPSAGLVSFSINYGTDGYYTNIVFSSKPITLPAADKILRTVNPARSAFNLNSRRDLQ